SLRPSKLDRKESYKAQRKNYAKEKKRVERELQSSFNDESIIVRSDWLKVRGSLKSWCKLWCIVKPGLLLLYKSPKVKSSHWIGTIILSTCELIERPSKKEGFCFKLFHPMDQSIWASKGPNGETIGAVVQPLPNSHLIFRAPNNAAGKCWMDALELALRCSSLLLRTMSKKGPSSGIAPLNNSGSGCEGDMTDGMHHTLPTSSSTAETLVLNESDTEKHFTSGKDVPFSYPFITH
ncbi:Oxysterol-binding protein, partial [Caligus rogercresseyi]